MADVIFQAGDSFRGYVIEKTLGRGGLGAVFLARHELMDQLFAIKILYPEVARETPEYVRRFVREARIAAKITSPNIVAVHDVGYDSEKDVYFLVMEYVDGGTLREAIALGGAMDPNEAARVVVSVAKALAAGEPFGVVHRDIKPENIMIARSGTVKLVDLGVAKASNTDSLRTMPNTVFGTPNYISPEQAQDSSTVDSRSDVYSLGIVFFELLAGRRPYECKTPKAAIATLLAPGPLPDVRTFNPSAPAPLAELINEMIAKDPAKRPAGASALVARLEALGYCGGAASPTAGASTAAQDGANFSYAAFDSPTGNDTLSFETKDEEIKSFVESAKAKRHRREILRLALPILLIVAAIAVAVTVIVVRML